MDACSTLQGLLLRDAVELSHGLPLCLIPREVLDGESHASLLVVELWLHSGAGALLFVEPFTACVGGGGG